MRRTNSIKSVMLMIVFAAALTICLSGCSVKMNYKYDDSDKYVAGDREISGAIEAVDIDYLSGDIDLTVGDSSVAVITETANKEIDEKLMVHSWLDGKTLRVRYCAAAKGLSINRLQKKLRIELPKDTKLSELNIDCSSGDIAADCSAADIDIEASSGEISLIQHGKSDAIELEASSGDVDAAVESADKMSIETSSGEIKLDAKKLGSLSSEASSGDTSYSFAAAPEEASIETSSGEVTIYLPEKSDITATIDTSSGDISYELPFSKEGSSYVCGSGENKLAVETSSGDIAIKKLAD